MKPSSIAAGTLRTYIRVGGPLLAKGLAFSLLLGLVPLMFFLLSLQVIFGSTPTVEFFQSSMFAFLPEDVRGTLVSQVLSFTGAGVGIVTIITFLGTSVALFDGLEMALTAVLASDRRKFHVGRLVSVAFLGLIVILFYAASLFGGLVETTVDAAGGNTLLVTALSRAIGALVSALVLMLIYVVFAGRRLRLGVTFLVSLGASVLWQLVLALGGALSQLAASRLLVYGALAFAIMLLIYMRILAELVILGGILVRVLSPPDEVRLEALLSEGEN